MMSNIGHISTEPEGFSVIYFVYSFLVIKRVSNKGIHTNFSCFIVIN